MLKGLLALFVSVGWMSAGTDTYRILSAIGDGVFHYLPLLIAVSAARKFGSNPFVAIALGTALMYPDMTNCYRAKSNRWIFGNPGYSSKLCFIGYPYSSCSMVDVLC